MPPSSPAPQPQLSPQPQSQPYDFITRSDQPASGGTLALPGSNSTIVRALYVAGGLFVLLILFVVIKSLLNSNPGLASFTGIAQDQQELIHLATNASQQPDLTTNDQNFAATSEISLSSSQATIIKYIISGGEKLKTTTLDLKVSAATDAQLTSATTAGTYDQTFQTVMNAKLATYASDLQQAYKNTSNQNSRAFFSSDYKQVQLLLTQLNAPANSD
jgi:hypothetical protein